MRCSLVLLLCALATSPAVAEPNEAEKLFRDMEKKIATAKTLELDVELKMDAPGSKVSVKGSMILGEGNRTRVEGSGVADGIPFKGVLISDGKKMHIVVNDKAEPTHKTPKQLSNVGRAAITRAGMPMSLPYFIISSIVDDLNINDMYVVSDFNIGRKEKIGEREAQEIQYTFTFFEQKESLAMSVWLDTKTNLPLKRVVTSTVDKEKFVYTEIISKMTLDPKIDAKKFELPKE